MPDESIQDTSLDFGSNRRMSNNNKLNSSKTSRRLRMNQVRFLALEGGGGKGYAYLGAIRTLEKMGILQFKDHRVVRKRGGIQGFAGSSAGAITAMLLSCGYSPRAIEDILAQVDFSTLFEVPESGRIPGVYGITAPFPPLQTNRNTSILGNILQKIGCDIQENIIPFLYLLVLLKTIPKQSPDDQPISNIFKNLRESEACLYQDWGIFCGDKFIDVFGRLIRGAKEHKIGDSNEEPDYSFITNENFTPDYMWTFESHAREFTKLGIMASNLETHKSVFFSPDTTPDFPVAVAVRMSMGLPMLFKPILITPEKYPKLPGVEDIAGVYVDGGLFNNVPLTVVDELWGKELGEEGDCTLALRLEEEQGANISSIFSFIRSWLYDTGAFGSGESQIQKTLGTFTRSILLNTDGLSMIRFSPPPPDVQEKIWQNAVERICEYFGIDAKKYVSTPDE
jgi:NTE family protein